MIKISNNMRSNNTLLAALAYAEAGWRIHPLKPNTKEPLLKDWPSKATNDVKTIKTWFNKNSNVNVGGIPPVNVFVLDSDGEDGKTSYQSMSISTLTAKVITPRGTHRYYIGKVSNNKIGLLKGLDLIGDDGSRYLVLPPSTFKGKHYKWSKIGKITQMKASDNDKIEKLLSKKSEKITANITNISEGSRNDTIFKIGCTLGRKGIESSLIEKALISINKVICEIPLPKTEITSIVQSIQRYDHNYETTFADMADVKQQEIDWFWYPYMARGTLTILEGPQGQGKSYLTMYLAALTTSGGMFPFSKEKMKSGRVLILNAEDDPASILRPRLEKCGAIFSKDNIRFQKTFVPIDKTGIELLETEISSYKPDLVIIDPLLTYMLGDMHRYNESTAFMTAIDQLARQYKCCIIGVRHLTKANNDDASKRGIGSVGFAARARSVIQVGKAPDDDNEKAVAHVKTNLGVYGKTLVFSLKGGGRDEVPEFVWEREADYSADALNKPNEPGRPIKYEGIEGFLHSKLASGPASISTLMTATKVAGLDSSKRTILRALEKFAVIEGKGPNSKWVLKI